MSLPEICFNSNSKNDIFANKNLKLYPNLRKQLQNTAIQRIGTDILNALKSIQRNEFVQARNKIDIPNGLFGLSLDNFYKRRNDKGNTVYIDFLEMGCKVTLEKAKICIVLDDLYDFVKNLFAGYRNIELGPIMRDISNSEKLLSIKETIAVDFNKNSELLKKLQAKLNAFNVRETNAILYVNSQVYGVQNDCVEAELVLEPIEFRYKMSFHRRTTEQSKEQVRIIEENLFKTLDDIEILNNRENIASDSIKIKQRMDIEILKTKIEEMTEKYDREYEIYDGQISYKTNAIEAMRDQYKDCEAKLEFYKSDIGRLREWQEMWKQKKLEEAQAEFNRSKPKKKKPTKKLKKK